MQLCRYLWRLHPSHLAMIAEGELPRDASREDTNKGRHRDRSREKAKIRFYCDSFSVTKTLGCTAPTAVTHAAGPVAARISRNYNALKPPPLTEVS